MAIKIEPDLPKKHDIRCTACNHLSEARVQSPHLCAWCDSPAVLWTCPPKVKVRARKYAPIGSTATLWTMPWELAEAA
jgi:hypothetical protein